MRKRKRQDDITGAISKVLKATPEQRQTHQRLFSVLRLRLLRQNTEDESVRASPTTTATDSESAPALISSRERNNRTNSRDIEPDQVNTIEHPRCSTIAVDFCLRLACKEEEINNFFQKSEHLSCIHAADKEDSRVRHFAESDGRDKSQMQQQFRALLAVTSLAWDYEAWSLSVIDQGALRKANVADFVRSRADVFPDQATARRAVHSGNRYRAQEQHFPGISAILAFEPNGYREAGDTESLNLMFRQEEFRFITELGRKHSSALQEALKLYGRRVRGLTHTSAEDMSTYSGLSSNGTDSVHEQAVAATSDNLPLRDMHLLPVNIISDTSQSIWYAMKGNNEGLQLLFSRGLASPNDVSSSRRFNLLHWALYGGPRNIGTVKFLLQQGATVDEQSFQHVWDFTYRKKYTGEQIQDLKCISFSLQRDWIEEQELPLVHNIILGRSNESLRDELDVNPEAVHLQDAQGRTALDWATGRAQLADMELLIERGSSVNSMDNKGRTTILHAVDSHNEPALRILLESGATPDPAVPGEFFRSSPLTAASFGGLVGMMQLLIDHGADVNAWNPEGRTALQAVASMQKPESAAILLARGADPNHESINGDSALTTAVKSNNHAILRLFIDHIKAYGGILDWAHLLPVVNDFADEETRSILLQPGGQLGTDVPSFLPSQSTDPVEGLRS